MSFHPARTFVLYTTLAQLSLGLVMATIIMWLVRLGLTAGEIALCQVACVATGVLAEVPTGMLADGKSRAWSIRVGLGIMTFGTLLYGFAVGFKTAVLAECVFAVGAAFVSGADEAWLADALKQRGEAERLGKVVSTAAVGRTAATLVGGVIGAVIAHYSAAATWFLSATVSAAALTVTFRFMHDEGEPMTRISEFEAFRRSWRALRTNRCLLWTTGASATYRFAIAFNMYWPIRFDEVGQVSLGGVWVVISGSLLVSSWLIRRHSANWRGHESTLMIGALVTTGLGLAFISLSAGLVAALAWTVVHELGRGAFAPPLSALTQRHVDSEYRATFGSFQSLLSKGGETVAGLSLAALMCNRTPSPAAINGAWLGYGLFIAAGAIVLWLLRPRLP